MKTLCVIGEALIDFIPEEKGQRLKDVSTFRRVAGGAPANVAASVTRLGGKAKMITQLGADAFGDHIMETLQGCGIDVSEIMRTTKGDTALAFVSLAQDGNRDFKFYRRMSADLLYAKEQLSPTALQGCGALHFCSVDLVESPMKEAHRALLKMAQKEGVTISFDPNLRLSLWEDEQKLKETVWEFLPYANILKIADEELEFITGKQRIEDALDDLFIGQVRCLLYTMGKDGAALFMKDGRHMQVSARAVDVMDTTGAGDSFIGAFLYRMLETETPLEEVSDEQLAQYLSFANTYAAHTTTKAGAIDALATLEELEDFKKQQAAS